MQTIQISENIYDRLREQGARLGLTPEQMIEHLLAVTVATEEGTDLEILPSTSEEALAAVRRLSTLFEGVSFPNVDAVLTDPQVALANASLSTTPL